MDTNLKDSPSRNSARPIFDPSQPYGIVHYPFYRVNEVAQIIGLGRDKTTYLFREGDYGTIHKIESQKTRKFRKNFTTILIPYETLVNFIKSTESGRVA